MFVKLVSFFEGGRAYCKRCRDQSCSEVGLIKNSVWDEETEKTNRFQKKTETKEERILNKRPRLAASS